jgi:hypothetical protein
MSEIRRIVNTNSKKNIGKFPSLKLGIVVWWESLIERDYLFYLEFDCAVSFYAGQPFRICFTVNGKRHSYTPDFLVVRGNKQQVVEVKPLKKAERDDFKAFCRLIAAVCRDHGYEFIVVTDADIRVRPKLDNIKALWRHARTPVLPKHLRLCREFFRAASMPEQIRLGQLMSFLRTEGVGKEMAYALLYQGAITTDLMVPLGEASIIRPACAGPN